MPHTKSKQVAGDQLIYFIVEARQTRRKVGLQAVKYLFDALVETALDKPCRTGPGFFEPLSFVIHLLTQPDEAFREITALNGMRDSHR